MNKNLPVTQNTRTIWLLLAGLAMLDAVWILVLHMAVTLQALELIFLPIFGLLGLAWFYSQIRKDSRLANLAHMTAATLGFMSATCILSYLVITIHMPLTDYYLAAADRALGLDWPGMYAWVTARPWLNMGMRIVYMCLIPQIVLLQFTLVFRGQITRGWELLWLFVFTCIGCVFFSGVWPAEGAFSYYHVGLDEPYLREFAALYDGSFTTIGAKGGMQGLVTFPSLHMALAIIFPYAARGVPVLFPLLLILDILIAATTPAIGGHHFADLWGGAVLALASIWLVRREFMTKLIAGTAIAKDKKIRGRNR